MHEHAEHDHLIEPDNLQGWEEGFRDLITEMHKLEQHVVGRGVLGSDRHL
jgi:hypothetical protein